MNWGLSGVTVDLYDKYEATTVDAERFVLEAQPFCTESYQASLIT